MKKIYVNKTDPVAAIIEKVIKSDDLEVLLYVPKGAELATSKNNFILLKRDADSAKKTVLIESTDKEARALAESVGMRGIDPLLGRSRKTVSDIISPTEAVVSGLPQAKPKLKAEASSRERVEADAKTKSESVPRTGLLKPILSPQPALSLPAKKSLFGFLRAGFHKPSLPPISTAKEPTSLKKKLLFWGLGVALLGLLVVSAVFVLPTAEITLIFQKVPYDFNGSLIVDSKLKETKVSAQEVQIAGENFLQKKNMTLSFPASGKQLVQKKATGAITIYNAFSSKTQSLVKDTRFSTPEGKIFRLDKSVTIPGAQIVDNKIVPSSVGATVSADKPGAEYNVGPVSRFRIPGFQGSPKYDGFYGESQRVFSGGFVGEVKVPTASDIASGKGEISKSLEDALQTQINVNFPPDIKVLNGASQFLITKETIDDIAGSDGNFKIIADAEMKILGFKEADLIAAFGSKLSVDSKAFLELDSHTIDYGESRVDFVSGSMSSAVTFKSTWKPEFDPQGFKKNVLGKSEAELKATVLGLQGIKSGSVKLWPFWVKSAPLSEGKVKIDVRHEL